MNQIEKLCHSLSDELSSMRCPDCGLTHRVEVSPLKGETPFSPNFPTLIVTPEESAWDCQSFLSKVQAMTAAARKDLMMRNGLL